MTSLDIAVFAVYVAVVTLFGLYFYRRANTAQGFTSADGRLGGWVVGLSIFGTYLSSISFLALPGKAYAGNWNAFAFSLSLPISAFIAAKWFVPLYRATGEISAYAYLERRFGAWARLYAMTFYLLTQFARMGTILFLVALSLERLTGWDISTIIIVTGVIVTLYTVVGGIEAVIWTDAIQSVVLTTGAVVCAVAIMALAPGGAGQILDIAGNHHKFSMGPYAFSFTQSTFWVTLVYGLFINLQNFGIDQSYIQRYHTARSDADARRSIWTGALMYIPVSLLFLFIGSELFALYTVNPQLLPESLHGPGMADRVFPHFIVAGLPSGFTGLLISALFAAAMSSIDSSLNSSATILMTDVYTRFANPLATDKQKMLFLRMATLALGVLGTGTALMMISVQGALDTWWRLAGVFSGGMLGLFLLAAFSPRTGSAQAMGGVGAGLLVIVWAAFSKDAGFALANPLNPLMTIVIGTITIIAVSLWLTHRSAPYQPAQNKQDAGQADGVGQG